MHESMCNLNDYKRSFSSFCRLNIRAITILTCDFSAAVSVVVFTKDVTENFYESSLKYPAEHEYHLTRSIKAIT